MKALFLMPPFSVHAERRNWHMLEEFYNPDGIFELVYLISLDEQRTDLPKEIGSLTIYSVRGFRSRNWALVFGSRFFSILNPIAKLVRRIAVENNIDVLVQRYGGPLKHGVPIVWAARSLGLPSVITLQNDYGEQLKAHYGPIRRLFINAFNYAAWKMVMDDSTIIWAVSEFLGGAAVEKGVPAVKVRVIPNKDSIGRFNQESSRLEETELFDRLGLSDWSDRKMMFLAVGRLIPQKNYTTVLDAFKNVIANHPQAVLVIVGQGELEQLLIKRMRENGLGKNARIIKDYLSSKELAVLYRKSVALVFCSLFEGQGRVVYEAMATGTPVIGSNVGPIPEMIKHNKNGLLVDPFDIDQIALSIEEFCVGNITKEELSEFCRDTADEYDLAVINPREVDLYKEAIARHKANVSA